MVQIQYFTRPVAQTDVLGSLIAGFDKGKKDRTDETAFDAAATAYGTPARPSGNLEALAGVTGYGGAPAQSAPQTPATAAIAAATRPVNAAISNTSNIPQGYLANARAAESGGNDVAANPNSSALGRYQFLEGTWNGLMQQYPELGLTADGRTDAGQQERAMEVFTRDNAGVLSSAGVPVNPGSLYAAHFLGAGGAQKVLTADPNTPMSALVAPGVMEANPHLQGMSAGAFAEWAQNKGGNSSGGYQAPMQDVGAGQGQPFTPDPETLRALLASEATRPLAMSLIQAQQETDASRGRFVTEQGEDGSIWQRDTVTGEQRVIREAPAPAAPAKPIEVGGVLLDPTTYQPIFDSRTTGTPNLPADVQEYQFYADQERAAGREPLPIIEYTQALKGNGLTVTTNPDGTTTVQQGGAPKPLTEAQSKDAVYATRAANALPTVDALGNSLLSFGENAAGNLPYGNYLQSEDYQVARDAGLEFLASILRKDTGAAVTPSEEALYGRIFLPQPGDKPRTLEMKQQRRGLAVEAIKSGMPPQALENMARALDVTDSPGAEQPSPASPAAPAEITEGTIIENDNGDRLVLRNGQWSPV